MQPQIKDDDDDDNDDDDDDNDADDDDDDDDDDNDDNDNDDDDNNNNCTISILQHLLTHYNVTCGNSLIKYTYHHMIIINYCLATVGKWTIYAQI